MTDTTQNAEGEDTDSKHHVPGLYAPIDGPIEEPAEISDQVKKNLKLLVKKFCGKNKTARRIEVKKARQQRAYLNGEQSILWDADQGCWRTFEGGTGRTEEDEGAYSYQLDVYGATARAMSAVLTQTIPSVRFEPSDPDLPVDLSTARAAESLRKVIERDSNIEQVLSDVARYMWTDGRTHMFTRWTTSAAAYGYKLNADGERVPNSRENVSAYGVLECRVPLGTRDQSEYPYLNLSYEIDKTTAQNLFPLIADKLTSGSEDSDFERIARQAVMSGTNILGSSENQEDSITYSRTWLRPSTFRAISEETERLELEQSYPDGVLVELMGDTFANARNENMDDYWTVFHPDSVDSQAGKSLGAMIVPIQDLVNETTNIRVESYSTGMSVLYCDKEVLDPAAISEQEMKPNSHVGATAKEGTSSLGDSFWQSEANVLPADLVQFFDSLVGPLLQKVSGVTDALFGQASSDNTTASGIAQLRDNALGQLGGSYRSLRRAYTKVIAQAVKCGFKYRDQDVKTSFAGKRGKSQTITVSLEDMKGDFKAYPASDEGFPQSWSNKRGIFLQLLSMNDPQIAAVLSQPKNMMLAKDLIGLDELEIPGADVAEKVMSAIEELLEDQPIPNIQIAEQYKQALAQAQATGQNPPPKPPFEVLFQCSMENDPIFDNAPAEFQAVTDWINSPEGQKQKKENASGFANVRLYGLAQKAVVDQQQAAAQQAAAPPPPAAKPPSLSANFKDLPIAAQHQALAELGFNVGPSPAPSMAPAPTPAPAAQPMAA